MDTLFMAGGSEKAQSTDTTDRSVHRWQKGKYRANTENRRKIPHMALIHEGIATGATNNDMDEGDWKVRLQMTLIAKAISDWRDTEMDTVVTLET